MKRMVKNGDLLDVEPDGTITVAGKPVGGGGGSDYTAGSNIQISEAKEISVNPELTEINGITFAQTESCKIFGGNKNILKIKALGSGTTVDYPCIYFLTADDSKTYFRIFTYANTSNYQTMIIDTRDFEYGKDAYAFLTRGAKVPLVPSTDGTYTLKATVSGNSVTYSWVAA